MGRDRDLLFAVTALDRGLLGSDEILALGPEIATHPDGSLADLLVERGRLSSEDRAQVEAQVEARLTRPPGEDSTTPDATGLDDSTMDFPGLSRILDLPEDSTAAWPPRTFGEASDSTVDAEASTLPDVGTLAPEAWNGPLADPPRSRARYRRRRCLARGGMGQIWLVRDEHLGREVILKVVRADRESDALIDRFLREAKISGRLEHPNIVTVHEVAGDGADGTPFYTMRHVRGRTLTHAIRAYHAGRSGGSTGRVELVGLLESFVTVCRAVAFAHRHGVVHRDLKPSNIALGDFGEVIVLDWGLAKLRGVSKDREGEAVSFLDLGAALDETIDGAILGTPPYMSPEQARGEHDRIDARSDVYSLGVILYEILTAHRPFSGPKAADFIRQIREAEPTPPRRHEPAAPAALAAACLKAMARDPADRYATASDLADDVRRWLADEPVSAYPEPWPTRLRRSARRHRTLVTAAGVLVATALVALVIGDVLVRIERDRTARERDRARVQGRIADAARTRAEASNDVASEVTNRLLVTVGDVQLTGLPGVETVRRRLADQAAGIYRKALTREPRDERLRYDAAQVFRHAGNIRRMVDDLDAARALLTEAIALLESLVQTHSEQRLYRDRLAETLRDLASIAERAEGPQAAERWLRRAIEVTRGLREDFPEEIDFARTEALNRLDLGSIELERGRFDDARDALAPAASILSGLADRGEPVARLADPILAVMACNDLAEACRRTGRRDEADRAVAEAIRRGRRNVEALAKVPDCRATLATALIVRARLLADDPGRRDDAVGAFDEAIGLLKGLTEQHRDITFFRRRLATALTERGRLRADAGPSEAALTDAREAVGLLEELDRGSPDAAIYHAPLGDALGLLGRLTRDTRRLEDARTRLGRALETNPDSPLAREALGRVEDDLRRLTDPDHD